MSATGRKRVVFMGTPAYSVPVLSGLLEEGYDVAGVYTQPDRPTGRGNRVVPPQVKRFALGKGLPVFQPVSLRGAETREQIASLSPDAIVVAAYGLLLPPRVLSLPELGCLNVHPSLLPRYRGASPVASAILNGDHVTGVTIIRMDEGMDTGPIIAQRETSIGPDDTTEDLTARLFQIGAALLVEVLPRWERGETHVRAQDDSQATVTRRLVKDDGEIDWGNPAAYIARQVRAYHPWPGSFTRWSGKLLKIIEASAMDSDLSDSNSPGRVVSLESGVGVVSGDGVLLVRRLQLEGRRALGARDFLQGYRGFAGSRLGS